MPRTSRKGNAAKRMMIKSATSGRKRKIKSQDSKREHRVTESQNLRVTDTHESHDTHEFRLFQRATTLQQAAQMALADNGKGDEIFKFARAVKAFEMTVNRRLKPDELPAAFSIWWAEANALLPADTDFDESLMLFCHAYEKADTPLGANIIETVMERLNDTNEPAEAKRYDSQKLKRLIHFCWLMQQHNKTKPFYLSVRDAAKVIGVKKSEIASAFLGGLVRDGVLFLVSKGTAAGRKASTFYYGSKPIIDEKS